MRSPEERFFAKVEKSEGCWMWRGATTTAGYGCFKVRSYVLVMAHRWSYEYHVGPIGDGLTIDHLCRTPGCVNPGHLDAVDQGENNTRKPRKTSCPQGHPFDAANTYVHPRPHPTSLRAGFKCRECDRIRQRARRAAIAKASA